MDNKLAEKIVAEVKRWAEANASFAKDNPAVSAQLKSLTQESISLGEPLKYCIAHIQGDATAVGGTAEQEYNATTKRTEAFEFTTRSFVLFPKTPTYNVTEIKNIASLECSLDPVLDDWSGVLPTPASVAETAVKELANKSMKRLNLYLYNSRVNEYTLVQETDYLETKLVSIKVDLKPGKKNETYRTVIGFYNTETGEVRLSNIEGLIKSQPIDSKTSKSTKTKNVVRTILIVVAVVAIVGFVVYKFLSD